MPAQEVKELSFDIVREKGNTTFRFQVPTFLTELYKAQGSEVKTSEKWKGLSFYILSDMRQNERYQMLLDNYRLFDNYGSSLMNNGRMNIAWLRTVDGHGEFQVPDGISWSELNSFAKNITTFLKEYFEEYLRECRIAAKVSFEF